MNNPITTQFITENQLKTVFTSIQTNVDPAILVPYITMSQQVHIEHRIGKALSDALKSEIEANTLTGNYKVLVEEYIAPALAYWTFYDAIPFLHMRIANKGIMLKTSDNSTNASLEELTWMRGSIRDSAEFFENRMINYLCDNKTLFPLYSPDTLKINTDTFRAGILIPNMSRKWKGPVRPGDLL